nr:MAG TPA: prohead serine protease [Caudoviricetes sp.]
MRISKRKQMLTTGIVDLNNNQIDVDAIDWSMFDRNPVLRYDRKNEGHKGVVIGKVIERERVGNGFAGRLVFMERFEDADIAFEKYDQGVLTYVSIGGYGLGQENEDGVFVCEKYVPREVSLVAFPANMECHPINESEVTASEKRVIDQLKVTGSEVRYLSMSTGMPYDTYMGQIEAAAEGEGEPVEAAAEGEGENIEASQGRRAMPAGMAWHEHNIKPQSTISTMNKTYKELICDREFQNRLEAVNAAFRSGSTVMDNTPENVETMQILASSMLADERMVVLASACNFTNGVTHERKNGLCMLVECAAGGAAAATLTAADLGVIKWMSLFLEKLLPNNTFMRSIRFVPMSDREGAIYIESGINPATYTGAVTPVNAPKYFYDDVKRTIARQVFSIQPITFQNADMAILAYDKQSWGWTTAMDSLMSDVCTYILQVIANTAGISKIPTTGSSFSSSGLFPIEAPNSAVTIKGVVADDIIMTEGAFLLQNYALNNRKVEIVLPANLYTKLATDATFKTLLTPHLSGSVGSGFEYSGSRITARNPVARYNLTSSATELDPAMYADGTVDNDGKITDVSPASTTKKHVGAGVAFVEGEVIAGVGTIDVIVMPDPQNYGYTMSGWMSTGATVARSNGVGAALIVPTEEAGA